MKRQLILAALALLMTSGAMARDLTVAQKRVFTTRWLVANVADKCQYYKFNKDEFIRWEIENHLTFEDSMALLEVHGLPDYSSETPDCAAWWEKYGVDGSVHANLLLRRED
jgi:hypothetical protein